MLSKLTVSHPLLGSPRRKLLGLHLGFLPISLCPRWPPLSTTSENSRLEILQCVTRCRAHCPKADGMVLLGYLRWDSYSRYLHLHLSLPQHSLSYGWGVDQWLSTCLVSVKPQVLLAPLKENAASPRLMPRHPQGVPAPCHPPPHPVQLIKMG